MKKLLWLFLSLFAFNVFASPVNVNTADAKTISDALSGIGLKKAEAIVKYRTEKGLFKKDILLSDTPIDATTPSADSKAVTESKPVTEPSEDVKPK